MARCATAAIGQWGHTSRWPRQSWHEVEAAVMALGSKLVEGLRQVATVPVTRQTVAMVQATSSRVMRNHSVLVADRG